MTNLKSLTVVLFVPALLLAAISIAPTHCSRSLTNPNDEKLVEGTCKNTPNYNLCLQYLKADPRSSSANVAGLGLIMVKAVTAKAKAASNRIEELLRGEVAPKQKAALESCAGKYKTIREADVPQATEALQKGDPKFAVDGANDAANEASYCEEELAAAGRSPLTDYNNATHDVAAVTAAIARQLL